MRKRILTPKECAELVPNWFELNQEKMEKLSFAKTRRSRFGKSDPMEVLAVPPIIAMLNRSFPNGFILDGKHRAVTAAFGNYNLEAYMPESIIELEHNVSPSLYKGPEALSGVIDAFQNAPNYFSHCKQNGIYRVADFSGRV